MKIVCIANQDQGLKGVAEPADVGSVAAIASWCECAQGRQPLVTALRRVARALGARSAGLSRLARQALHVSQAQVVGAAEIVASSREIDRSYAHCVLGSYVDRPRAGSLWLSSLVDEPADPSLAVFQAKSDLAETAVIPLCVEDKRIDFLELHFQHPLDREELAQLNQIADGLSRIWATRSPGLFSEAILARRDEMRAPAARLHLLDTANPAGLSRSEFRVCLLLSRGLNRSSLCAELGISSSTLRTHLRNIFRKTGVNSLPELVFVLLSQPRGRVEANLDLPARLA